MDYGHFMGFGGGFMWIILLLLIALVVWLVLGVSNRERSSSQTSAREILDRRYARGEIDHDTYERMKRDLD